MLMAMDGFKIVNGVHVSQSAGSKFGNFERSYLEVREKEKRVLSIAEIRRLPDVDKGSGDHKLWKTRRHNIGRFLNYLSRKKKPLHILDVGCGNGFFTNLMRSQGHQVTGLDVNLHELTQAAEAFGHSNITWLYADVFSDSLPGDKFDIITFCCSLQYFKDPERLLQRCRELIRPGGEIHIIDSPFYNEMETEAAKNRSLEYFRSIGAQNMQQYYHHHSFRLLRNYNFIFKYKPNKWRLKIFKDSPFPWIMIT
jgi:ubiquinone/menaquinone biosynthesis C-methylase UbiE